MNRNYAVPALAFFVLIGILFIGCEAEDELTPPPEEIEERDPADVAVGFAADNAWVRVGPEGGTTAAYLTLRNTDPDADTLQSAQTDVAQQVEIHETYEDEEGLTGMREVDNLPVEGHSEVHMNPGGLHLMLVDLTRSLEAGETVDIELEFAREGTHTFTFQVQELEEDDPAGAMD